MSKRRRTAAEALEVPINLQEFISKGVPPGDDQRSKGTATTEGPALAREDSKQPEDLGVAKRGTNREGKPKSRTAQSLPDDLALTYAKATIQKTVRFRPELISQLELWSREQHASGELAKSFQQVQNEALSLWLEKNKSG